MTIPLIILAFLSIFGGWFAAPKLVGGTDRFEAFLHPVFASYEVQASAGREEAAPRPVGEEGGANPAMDLVNTLPGPPVVVACLAFSSRGGSTSAGRTCL
jgi:hypothetical protein